MRRSWASITVGALVLLVGVISYKLIRSTSERNTASEGMSVWALFHDATGLFEKSRVMTAGISVGQIEKRELDPKTAKAKITIRIAPNVTLYENAVVTKKSASLLGEYYLEIDPGTEFKEVNGRPARMRPMKDGEELKNVIEPVSLGDMMASVGTLIPVMREILQDVRTLTSGPISDIANNVSELIERNSEVLDRLLSRVEHIAATVDNVTTAEAGDVKESIKNVREITESIKSLIGTTHEQVAKLGEKGGGSIDKLQASIDNLDKTMKNMEEVTSQDQRREGHDRRAGEQPHHRAERRADHRGRRRLRSQHHAAADHRGPAQRVQLPHQLVQELPVDPADAAARQVLSDRAGRGPARLPHARRSRIDNNSQTGTSSDTRVTLTEQLRFTLQFGKRVA